MENKATNVWTAFGVVSLVILLLGLFIWFLSYFIQSDFALALLGLAGAITTASFQYRAAKDRESEARLFSEKQKVYTELTEIIMDLFHSQKDPERRIGENELVNKLQRIRTKLIVWGSSDTIRSLDQIGEIGLDMQETNDPTSGLIWLSRLIAHMRKDLGTRTRKVQ